MKLGTDVSYHDPYVPVAPKMRSWPTLPAMTSRPLTLEVLGSADVALLIVDTRGIYRVPAPHVVKA